jgi:phospholipase D1/2
VSTQSTITNSLVRVILSAPLSFGIDHRLGRQTVRRLAGSRLEQLSQRLARQRLLTVIAVRIIPVAPFTVINLIEDVSPIRLRDFLLGTVAGMLPGLLGIAIFIDQVSATIRDPKPASLLVLAAVVSAIPLGALGLRRWLSKRVPVRAPLPTSSHLLLPCRRSTRTTIEGWRSWTGFLSGWGFTRSRDRR